MVACGTQVAQVLYKYGKQLSAMIFPRETAVEQKFTAVIYIIDEYNPISLAPDINIWHFEASVIAKPIAE